MAYACERQGPFPMGCVVTKRSPLVKAGPAAYTHASATVPPPQKQRTIRMSTLPPCPKCQSIYTYEDGVLLICPECSHEWSAQNTADEASEKTIVDAVGNPLSDGDSVTVIKDLKVKGSSSVVKVGTKVKSIRLVDGDHDIDCKIPGIGAMGLKSQFVKKI